LVFLDNSAALCHLLWDNGSSLRILLSINPSVECIHAYHGRDRQKGLRDPMGRGRLDAVDAVVSVLDCISAALEQLHDNDQDTSNMHSDAV